MATTMKKKSDSVGEPSMSKEHVKDSTNNTHLIEKPTIFVDAA